MPNRTREAELLQAAAADLEARGLGTSAHQLEVRADAIDHLVRDQLIESATADLVDSLGVSTSSAEDIDSAPA